MRSRVAGWSVLRSLLQQNPLNFGAGRLYQFRINLLELCLKHGDDVCGAKTRDCQFAAIVELG